MQAFYTDHFVLPLPDGHRFPIQKYAMLRERLLAEMPDIEFKQALSASDDELVLVHTQDYIEAVTNGKLSSAQQREIGFPWSLEMAERARRSVGATVQAARVALSGDGVAANLAGGTHHAYPDKGSGLCVFTMSPWLRGACKLNTPLAGFFCAQMQRSAAQARPLGSRVCRVQ